MQKTRVEIKKYFGYGDKPSVGQYLDLLDSVLLRREGRTGSLSKVLFVDSSAIAQTGLRGNINCPFKTLTEAKEKAVAGDLIFVFPGVYYDVDLMKNGIEYYFCPNSIVKNDLISTPFFTAKILPFFDLSSQLLPKERLICKVSGYAKFISSANFNGTPVPMIDLQSRAVLDFEAESFEYNGVNPSSVNTNVGCIIVGRASLTLKLKKMSIPQRLIGVLGAMGCVASEEKCIANVEINEIKHNGFDRQNAADINLDARFSFYGQVALFNISNTKTNGVIKVTGGELRMAHCEIDNEVVGNSIALDQLEYFSLHSISLNSLVLDNCILKNNRIDHGSFALLLSNPEDDSVVVKSSRFLSVAAGEFLPGTNTSFGGAFSINSSNIIDIQVIDHLFLMGDVNSNVSFPMGNVVTRYDNPFE